MSSNAVCWFEIYVDDMDRAKRFYESVFQVKLDKLPSPSMELWAFPADMERYGSGGALAKMDGAAAGGHGTLVYFSCEDCATQAQRIGPAGGLIVREKMSIGQFGFIALARDTEGNMIGLHSLK